MQKHIEKDKPITVSKSIDPKVVLLQIVEEGNPRDDMPAHPIGQRASVQAAFPESATELRKAGAQSSMPSVFK